MPDLVASRFPGDDGAADPAVADVLARHASGAASTYQVTAALATSRLLVPVVAVLTEEEEVAPGELRREKESDMALPTLVGADGRRGVLAFTSADTLRRWRADARPVPVHTAEACQAALSESAAALVVDVAGPVPFVIDGAYLAALADGRPPPPPHEDPAIRQVVDELCAADPAIAGVALGPGTQAELLAEFTLAADADQQAAQRIAQALTQSLGGAGIGGIELRLVQPSGG